MRTFFWIWLVLGIMGGKSTSVMATPALTLAYENKHNFPFYIGNSEEVVPEKPGLAVDAILALQKKVDVKIQLTRCPWKRCFALMEAGQVDGVFIASFKPERMQQGVYPTKNGEVDPTRRVTSITYILYKTKDSPLQWDGKQFLNLDGAIGAPLGYSISGDLRKMGIPVDESENTLTDLSKLTLGRVKGVAALELSGDFYLKSDPKKFKDIMKVDPPLETKAYYLMFSHQFMKTNAPLAETLWNAIPQIRESEEFHQMNAKYLQ